jgi:hypothetical protein
MCSSWPLLLDGEWQTILEVSFLLFQTDWSKFEIKKEVASFLY